MDRIFKAVSDEVKEKSAFQRELFRICYERKRARYEEGYTSLVMNRYFNLCYLNLINKYYFNCYILFIVTGKRRTRCIISITEFI